MRTTTLLAALGLAAVFLAGCGSPPAQFEGSALQQPFEVRSALFGPAPQFGGNNPPSSGATLVFTDAADYCEYMQRVREALSRGERAPAAPADLTATLLLRLAGSQMVPELLTAGTYPVLPQDFSGEAPPSLPLRAFALFSRKGTTGGYASEGTVQVAFAKLRAGAETTGELSLELVSEEPGGVQGSLAGTFTATYCEYL